MEYPFPNKPLRDRLGEEGTEAFVEYIHKVQDNGRNYMIELSTERYERRLAEEVGSLKMEISELRGETKTLISELKAEMHAGFGGIQEQFQEVYREIARIHERISQIQDSIHTQTRWIIASIFGAVPFYLALYKFLG